MTTSEETSPLNPMLRKLAYWVKLDADDSAAILGLPHTIKTLERGSYIVREFDRAEHTCVLLSGFAVRQKTVASGHRQIVSVHMKGEMVDLQNSFLGKADHSVQMLTDGRIASIRREAVNRVCEERFSIARAMWMDTLVDGSIFREWITNIGRRDARTRIAHLLCEFSLRLQVAGLGEQTDYELPMTQEQLADATGLTPVHVNRSLKALEADGHIRRRTPRSIVIGDWKTLVQVADFNSNYLHLKANEPALEG
jgi:CRP-like cAMP-binding protein